MDNKQSSFSNNADSDNFDSDFDFALCHGNCNDIINDRKCYKQYLYCH
jgi:hypothetical protein